MANKKVENQPLAAQSLNNVQNAITIVPLVIPTTLTKKRTLTHASTSSSAVEKKQKEGSNSDSEGSTDRDSLTRSDSLISYISSEEDNAL